MPNMKLTKRSVDALPRVEKATYYFDSDLKGFFLRAMPSGAKAWGVEYRAGTGRGAPKRRYTIGAVTTLTPNQARGEAKRLLAEVAIGNDPATAKQNANKEISIHQLINLWDEETPLSRRTGKAITPRVKTYTLGRLRAHVVPLLGKRKANELSAQEVASFIAKVSAGKTASKANSGKKRGRTNIKGGNGAARKVASDLSMIMNFAVERGIAQHNPVTAVTKPKVGKRNDYLRTEEIASLGKALLQLEEENANPMGIAINRLLLLTGARPAEIEGLQWSEIDFDGICFRLENTKTGYSVRPISQAVLDLLKKVERGTSPYVFPSYSETGHYTSSRDIWRKARDIAGLPEKVRYHARHAVATLALSAGHDVGSVAAIMGHKSPRTTLSTYAHIVDERAKEVAQSLGEDLAKALGT